MSVLIRGMRFPKTCDECLINCGHSMLYINITDMRSPNCPLVEIPTPHGRLIDADKLMRDIEEYHLSDGKFQHWVDVQQTVIEAEDGTE